MSREPAPNEPVWLWSSLLLCGTGRAPQDENGATVALPTPNPVAPLAWIGKSAGLLRLFQFNHERPVQSDAALCFLARL